MWCCRRFSVLLPVLASIAGACAGVRGATTRSAALPCPAGADSARLAAASDQTAPSGVLFADTLDVQMTVGPALLLPEGEDGPRLDVVTFGEAGVGPSLPGPLVRAPAGTTVLARVCNTLADTVWLLGVADRGDTVPAPPGVITESVFTLDAPGIRVYRGVTREDTVMRPFGPTATLAGAIIADGEERWGDRVLVLTDWAPESDGDRFALQVNGMSWPHTERLHYSVGETARWIVVNASPVDHPMHLHGFHFLVTARSNAAYDSVYPPERRRLAVTELLRMDENMALEWAPERGGRWLFHCHITSHMDDVQRFNMLGIEPRPTEMHGDHHAERAMAGLVVGIEISGDPAEGLADGAPAHGSDWSSTTGRMSIRTAMSAWATCCRTALSPRPTRSSCRGRRSC